MRASGTDLPTGEAKRTAVRQMFDTIAPRYDLVNRVMTFGLDARWRRHTIDLLALPRGSLVADVACGTGDFARELSARSYRSVGLDLSLGMLHNARAGGAPLACADAARMPLATACLEGIVSGFAVRNFSELEPVLAELARVLKPGGRIAVLEIATPPSRLLRLGNNAWCRVGVPLLGALLSDAAAYRYLPRSVAYLPTHERLDAMLRRAGFAGVRQHLLSGGIVQVVTATRGAAVERRSADWAERADHAGSPTGAGVAR
jgi:demethylmenaquinone methyltransferase/2-methoxy-6-polyprenyl-1,4-benzoquinol methylase